MTLDVGGGLESADDQRNQKTSTEQLLLGAKFDEDPNSPLQISSSSSGTLTLSNSYAGVWLVVTDGSTGTVVDMRINGDSGSNYITIDTSGSETKSQTEVPRVLVPDRVRGQMMQMTGKWGPIWNANIGGLEARTDVPVRAKNQNVTGPLDSITFTAGSSFSLTVHALGVE